MGLIHFNDKDHFCIPNEKRFDESAIRTFCTQQGLAFYDTATEIRRLKDNASDVFLEVVTPTDIPALLQKIPNCTTLVTTGQKATEVIASTFNSPIPPIGTSIGLNIETGHTQDGLPIIRQITFFRMPSTSRAYPLSIEKKAAAYRIIFWLSTT